MQFIRVILNLYFALLICADLSLYANAKPLPQIRRASGSISTDSTKPEASKTLVIRDIQGRPAYELDLFAISLNHQTTYSVGISLSTTGRYSPDAEEKYEPNLLNPDYWGHGDISFRPDQLCPANRDNPLFGARREYILRRMRIVVTISDIELNDDGIVKMQMIVTVEPSKSIRKIPKDTPWNNYRDCDGSAFYNEERRTNQWT